MNDFTQRISRIRGGDRVMSLVSVATYVTAGEVQWPACLKLEKQRV